VLFEYAGRLADTGRADTVSINAVGPDGHEVVVTYLLDHGSTLMKESADAALVIPDNSEAIAYMNDRLKSLLGTHDAQPMDKDDLAEIQRGFDSLR